MFWWFIVFLAIFLIGLTKSGFGSGFGLMVVPMVAVSLGHLPGFSTDAALGLLLPLLLFGDLIAVWQYRKLFRMAIVRRLMPGTAVGVVLGALCLFWFGSQRKELADALIRMEIGMESIGLVLLHLLWFKSSDTVEVPSEKKSAVVGMFAGVSSTLAHAAGPIITLYLIPQKLDRQLFVSTCALYFFLLNSAKLPAYYWSGQFKHISPGFSLLFCPVVVAGALSGVWMNRRVSDKTFSQIVYFFTLLLGIYILADGTLKLIHYM